MIGIASAWIAELGVAYIMTTVTGSIVYLLWRMIYRLFDRPGYIKAIYYMLRVVMLFYLIPVSYIGVIICVTDFSDGSTLGLFGESSPTMRQFYSLVGCIWLAGVLVLSLLYVKNHLILQRVKRTSENVNNKWKNELEEYRHCIGLNRNIALFQKKEIYSALTGGCLHPFIILPGYGEYSDRENELMILHELIHIKYHDIFWNRVANLVWGIHWMNPLIWFFVYWNQKWCEAHCDYECVRVLEDGKEYSNLLLSVAIKQRSLVLPQLVDTMLFHNESLTKERISRMMRYREFKRIKRCVMIGVMAGFLLLSTTTVFAATYGLWKGQEVFMLRTMAYMEEEVSNCFVNYLDEEVFSEADLIQAGYVEAMDMDGSLYRGSSFERVLAPGYYKTSSSFTVNAGGSISIIASVDPDSEKVSAGIVQPDGVWRGVSSIGDLSHTFSVSQTGAYKVYIRNDNSSTVTMSVTYQY